MKAIASRDRSFVFWFACSAGRGQSPFFATSAISKCEDALDLLAELCS